jgi:hypothetical protein
MGSVPLTAWVFIGVYCGLLLLAIIGQPKGRR